MGTYYSTIKQHDSQHRRRTQGGRTLYVAKILQLSRNSTTRAEGGALLAVFRAAGGARRTKNSLKKEDQEEEEEEYCETEDQVHTNEPLGVPRQHGMLMMVIEFLQQEVGRPRRQGYGYRRSTSIRLNAHNHEQQRNGEDNGSIEEEVLQEPLACLPALTRDAWGTSPYMRKSPMQAKTVAFPGTFSERLGVGQAWKAVYGGSPGTETKAGG